jgi:branched-chain amino acid transport system ATP-binding protein
MKNNNQPLLDVKHVSTNYGNICALRDISFTVNSGEIVCLIGANGAGKTTMLKTICGLLKPQSGEIIFEEKDITHLPAHEIVRKGIAMVPEGRQIFSRLTTLENIEMGAYSRNDKAEIQRDVQQMFKLFPRLQERRKQAAGTLSGGEQQMLAIARALMARPRLLLLDEPSMGLAPILLESIMEKIVEINKTGTTILLVEQNTLIALSVAQRGYVLQTGEICLQDTAERLKKNDLVRKAYLGMD